MAFSLYQPSSSSLHRADPAVKILALCAWFAVALAVRRPASIAVLAGLVAGVAAAQGLLGILARFGRFMALLFVACALLWSLFSYGSPEGDGGFEGTGLWRGLWVGLRLVTLLAMGLLFLVSTRVEEMAAGLQRLRLPFMAAFSLTLAFRLLPLFSETGAVILSAQACRGVDVGKGWLPARLLRYLPLLVPLVLSCLRTADGLSVALESRGLGMYPSRTSVLDSRPGPSDWAALLLSLGALAAIFALRLAGTVL